MGSKRRFAKEIVPILNSYNKEFYIEPFVGGANIIDKVDFPVKLGYDKNPYLISLLDYVSKGGELPTSIKEEEYYKVRDNKKDFKDWYVGLVGFCASYGGRFFEGFPRGPKPDGTPRDYTNEAIRNIEKQRENLNGITFQCKDFIELDFKEMDSLIYCDPPYLNSKPYKVSLLGKFNHRTFWEWVNYQSKFNPVIISEYNAPKNYVCIWSKDGVKSTLSREKIKTSTEKLFINKKWIK